MLDVITIGTAVRDLFVKSKEFKVLKEKSFTTGKAFALPLGAKIDLDEMVFSSGGMGINSAITFARQGYKTACLCRVGDDMGGEEIRKDILKDGISEDFIRVKKGENTGYSILLLNSQGERTILTSRGASANFHWAEDVNEAKMEASWFYLGGSLPIEFVESTVELAKRKGARVAFAPSKVHIKLGLGRLGGVFKKTNLVTMNREEAAAITEIDYKNEKEIFTKLDEYVEDIVVMTEGARGVLVSDGRNIYQAGIFKEKKLIDRTGAGDAFGSAFVASLMNIDNLSNIKEEDMKLAIRLASANSTSVVEYMGANAGILKKEDFENDSRWDNLDIKVKQI